MKLKAAILFAILTVASACSGQGPTTSVANPVDDVVLKDPVNVTLWHTQTGSNAMYGFE